MFPLGLITKQVLTTVFDAQFNSDYSDNTGNFTPTVAGSVPLASGEISFNNSYVNYINYVGTKLRLQTDTEFVLRFKIEPKSDNHILLSCLNSAGNNGFYIFVNEVLEVLGFYSVGLGGFSFTSVAVPIGVYTTVKCVVQKSRQRMLVYVDNVLLSNISTNDLINLTNEPRFVNLGSFYPNNTAQPLKGKIDFVTINER